MPYFARTLTDGGMASSAVTFYRWALSAMVLLPSMRLSREKIGSTLWAVGSGLGLGLGWVAYVEALSRLPVSTVGVIYMTYPLFAVLAAWMLFKQRPRQRSLVGSALVIVAAALALSPAVVGTLSLGTLALALAAPLSFGFAITVLSERLSLLGPLERIAAVAVGVVVGVSPMLVTLTASQFVPSSATDWWLVLGMGVLTSLLPKIGYSTAAPFVGAARTATAGAVELPTIFVVGWLVLGEPLGWAEVGAGLLILAAVLLTPSRPPSWDLESKGRRSINRREL